MITINYYYCELSYNDNDTDNGNANDNDNDSDNDIDRRSSSFIILTNRISDISYNNIVKQHIIRIKEIMPLFRPLW